MSIRLSWLIGLTVFLFDQLAKQYISKNLSLGRSIPVIKNVFHLTLVHNTGVAFGLFKNRQVLFIIITSIVILYIALALFLNRKQNSLSSRIAFGLILGGACGNLFDRLKLGFIIDFFDFRIWPVFNIADSAITLGVALLAIEALFAKKRKA
ncbi:MAG: signal peptidase II [Omnitrophica WOR_2 bacterium RIFCSPHIGHO2_02_FULL_45_21]|nr:MAG: signal peptidase II [Omnitrophica WOR_2 bacterium RIFCSPHIGHO2_02_FULL_45_21]